MKRPTYADRSRQIISQNLPYWGFAPNVQQRVGAFVVLWGVFETTLESTLWSLNKERVEGVRPSTEGKPLGDWIKEFGKARPQFSVEANEVLSCASHSALDLMEYRHTIIHGAMLPSSDMPSFIRNPRWHGEARKRSNHDAYVSENLLDMAIDCVWILGQTVFAARKLCADQANETELVCLMPEIQRAQSHANELRHLKALVNSEKY